MEQLNAVTGQLKTAVKEQALASSEIGQASEVMMSMTSQVDSATSSQAEATSEIVRTIDHMNDTTQVVAQQAAEQREGTDAVVAEMGNVESISRRNLEASGDLSKAAEDLTRAGQEMAELVSRFQLERA